MIVAYNIAVDGWTPCQTTHKTVVRGYGPIEISEKAWNKLSVNGVISCTLGLTDTEHLVTAASFIDGET